MTEDTYEHGNLLFALSNHPRRNGADWWLINVRRISDGRHLNQFSVARKVEDHEWPEVAASWTAEHPGLDAEPEPVLCRGCRQPLESDHDTDYQFDNALWITVDGGYGMFVESESFMRVGDFWATIPDERRHGILRRNRVRVVAREIRERPLRLRGWRWLLQVLTDRAEDIRACPMPLPDELRDEWDAWYEKNREDRAVICHDCAHQACELLPWLGEWLDPERSHAHRTAYMEAHPDHFGWDYSAREGS